MIAILPQASSVAPPMHAHQESRLLVGSFNAREAQASSGEPVETEAYGHADYAITVPVFEAPRWTTTQERQFAALAIAEATGTASQDDLVELEHLSEVRRKALNALTAEEVLFQYRRRKVEDGILAGMRQYVDILELPRNPIRR